MNTSVAFLLLVLFSLAQSAPTEQVSSINEDSKLFSEGNSNATESYLVENYQDVDFTAPRNENVNLDVVENTELDPNSNLPKTTK